MDDRPYRSVRPRAGIDPPPLIGIAAIGEILGAGRHTCAERPDAVVIGPADRGERLLRGIIGQRHHDDASACMMPSSTRSQVMGKARWRWPVVSARALAMAAGKAVIPISPPPLAPQGPSGSG